MLLVWRIRWDFLLLVKQLTLIVAFGEANTLIWLVAFGEAHVLNLLLLVKRMFYFVCFWWSTYINFSHSAFGEAYELLSFVFVVRVCLSYLLLVKLLRFISCDLWLSKLHFSLLMFCKTNFFSLALIIFGEVHIFCAIFAWRVISTVCIRASASVAISS
jgi:hypothetical protein